MDIKLVILLAVAIAIIFLLMNEMNTLREDLDKRMTDLNNRISKYNEDTKATFRKEARDVSSKYKTYTTEMMKELRIMNSIENQAITHMSDQFAEADGDAESADRNIPHLSDMNLPRLQAQQVQQAQHTQHAQQAQLARGQVVYSRDTHSKEVREVVDLDNVDGASNTANVDIVVGKNDRNGDDADEEYYMSSETAEFKLKEDGETLPSAHEEADHTDYDTEDLDGDADSVEGEEGTGDVDDDESDIDEEDEEDESEDEENAEPEAETNEADDVDNVGIEDGEVGEVEGVEEGVEEVLVKKVSRNHQKIRASMEDDDDDDSSVENDEVEDMENTGESISMSTQEEFRLKSISRYSKQQLVEIANTRGVKISVRSNKNVIYNQIKATL